MAGRPAATGITPWNKRGLPKTTRPTVIHSQQKATGDKRRSTRDCWQVTTGLWNPSSSSLSASPSPAFQSLFHFSLPPPSFSCSGFPATACRERSRGQRATEDSIDGDDERQPTRKEKTATDGHGQHQKSPTPRTVDRKDQDLHSMADC